MNLDWIEQDWCSKRHCPVTKIGHRPATTRTAIVRSVRLGE
jgi:hypothetical protein